MAIFKLDIVDIDLNNGSVHRSFMSKTLGEGDKQANRFGVHLIRNGEEVSLEDATCTGYFIRADGGTVVIPGIVNGNLAYVRLPETCYAIEGQFSLAIKVESGTVRGTMRIIDGVVANVSTDAIVDPGTILPSIEDLIDAIDEAVSSIPADYSDLWECLAPNYSNEKLYRKGQYCTYDGGVYRCLINIEATENWKSAHWQQVTIGDQLMSVMETNPENKWTAGDLVIPEDDGYLNLADIDEGISLPAGTYNLSGVAFSEGANTDIRFRFNAGGDTVNVDLAADGLFHDTTFTLSAAATLIRVQTGHTVETSEGFGGYLNHVTLIEADSSAGFIPNITAVDSIARLPNVYPSGLTDGTDADNMINAIRLTGGYCKLAPGTYYIDVMAFPSTPVTIEGSGKETVIVVDNDADYTYGIRLSNNSAIRHLTVKSSDSTYTPADIYTGTVKHGINIRPATGTGKTHVSIEDVTVENFSGAGILLNQTGQDSDDGCHVLNCFVSNCGAGIWTNTNAEFNRIDCCNFAGCYYGAINDGGNNVFSNCGFSGNKYGFFMDNTSGNLSNNSHGSVIGCVFNHEDYDSTTLGKGYGIYLIGVTSGMQFVGGQLFYAGIYLKDCTAVVISNFNFGKMIENSTDVGVKIEVVRTSGNRLLLLTDSVFAIAPRLTATSSANQKVFVNSCYTRDGALIPSITPGFTPTTEIAPQYSASSTYAVGQYVFYNDELKRCTTAITTAEAYTAAHWTDATLANDVSDLKSAIDGIREHTKNLFEPDNVLNAYFTTSNIKSNSSTRLVWIPCEASKTYTVSKTAGTRFAVGYTTVAPAVGVTPSGVETNYEGSSITITTGADAQYLVAWVYNGGSDSGTAEAMLASIQIEEGSTATAYEPPYSAIDRILRNSALTYRDTLASGTDLNNIKRPTGYYVLGVNSTYSNMPLAETESKRRMLFCYAYGNYSVHQILCNITDGIIYQRLYTSNAWSDWEGTKDGTLNNYGTLPNTTPKTDLNTLYGKDGFYTMGVNSEYDHDPVGPQNRRLLVCYTSGSTFTHQILFNSNTGDIYQRVYASSTWSAWKQLPGQLPEICGSFTNRICTSHAGVFSNSKYQNSPKAFKEARKLGIIYQELDVVFTSDNVPVLAHSSFADNAIRIADGDTSQIRFKDYTVAQLKENYVFGDSNYSWTILTLAEGYALLTDLGCIPIIDVGGGSNNPTGSRETLVPYMIANGIECEGLITSERDSFEILCQTGGERYPLGVVIANSTTDSLTVAENKIADIISAKSSLHLEKAWCFIRRERVETGGDLLTDVSSLLNAGIKIAGYSYDSSTYNTTIPTFFSLVISAKVNINYLRYLDAIAD